jgi:hypothetical protein
MLLFVLLVVLSSRLRTYRVLERQLGSAKFASLLLSAAAAA